MADRVGKRKGRLMDGDLGDRKECTWDKKGQLSTIPGRPGVGMSAKTGVK